MSSNDILTIDYASFIESEYLNLNSSTSLTTAKYVVNPKYSHLVNKIIIINLPIEISVHRLLRYNKIISRFPIAEGIRIEPYEVPKETKELEKEDYSCLILNKAMLLNPKYLEVVSKENFLLGIDTLMDGFITLAGYIILKNSFQNLNN
jgi:hypothetical protein